MSSVSVDQEVLHALRICGFADTDRLTDYLGLPTDVTEARLRECEALGFAKYRGGRIPGWSLTPPGREQHAVQMACVLTDATARDLVDSGYGAFLAHNRELKEICTAWQLQTAPDGSSVVNAHDDPAYDREVIARLVEVHNRCGAMFERLTAGLPRFGDYRRRLGGALDRLTTGDVTAFATPMSASYHCVWMELHQDLLLTLGRQRDEADGH